jgi:hypothetical protein
MHMQMPARTGHINAVIEHYRTPGHMTPAPYKNDLHNSEHMYVYIHLKHVI